jgi:TolA-binding protein
MDILALIESGNDSAAQTAVDSLIANFKDNPDLSESVFNVGEQYYLQALSYEKQNINTKARENFEKAIGIWEKMMKQLPSSSAYVPHAYYYSGSCYERLNEFAKAVQHYQKVVDDWPKFQFAWNALFLLGRSYEGLKESGLISNSEADAKTKAVYQQLLERYPSCPAAKIAKHWLNRQNSSDK